MQTLGGFVIINNMKKIITILGIIVFGIIIVIVIFIIFVRLSNNNQETMETNIDFSINTNYQDNFNKKIQENNNFAVIENINTANSQINTNSEFEKYILGPGDYEYVTSNQSIAREYMVYVPSSYNKNDSIPLILVFHGASGTAEGMIKTTDFNNKSDSSEFAVAYLNGAEIYNLGKNRQVWNAGNCSDLDNNADDISYVGQVLDDISLKFNINQSKIYAAGFSNGGMMVHRLACDMSDRISGIAAVAGGLSQKYEDCNPIRKIPILHIHGLNDLVAKFNGGVNVLNTTISGCYIGRSIPDIMNFWKIKYNCSSDTEISYGFGKTVCLTSKDCDSHLELCTITDGGHNWFVRDDFNATDYIWDNFFKNI